MSKKIMQINITCGRGSTGRISVALYDSTILVGYKARFAYSTAKPTIASAFLIESKVQNYMRRGLNKYFGRRIRYSAPGTKRLIRYIRSEKPDLIHIHNIQQNSVDYPMLFKLLLTADIPIVYTLHDCWAFTGGCYHYSEKGCAQYKTGCEHCQPPIEQDDIGMTTQKVYKIKQHLIGSNKQIHVVCVSNWLRDSALQSYMGSMVHLPQTIYNGVDTQVFFPRNTQKLRAHNQLENKFVILGVASYWTEDRKGLQMFRELAEKISEDVEIILIGTDSEKIKDSGIRLINVITLPKTENTDELAQYYSLADVFINASLEETFGMTTAEALACGTPAIVFNSTACPEVISEDTGISVDQHSADALLNAVNTVKRSGKGYYSGNCVRRVNKCFSQERMTNAYLTLYRRILENDEYTVSCE